MTENGPTTWLEAGGTRVALYEWGDPSDPAVLYWDGLGGTGLHANEIGPILAADYGMWVVAPDAPGHGRSLPLLPEDYRPSRLAELAADLLTALRRPRAAFVGFSWGAEIGCWLAARFPERTSRLVLIDGGHWDLADLPEFDTTLDLDASIARARERKSESYASWDAYFAAEEADLGRWTTALAAAHRATMREEEGWIVPILSAEVRGAVYYGNCIEPTSSTHAALAAAEIPILFVTRRDHGRQEEVARNGIARFRANVPQLSVHELPGGVHDVVSAAPAAVGATLGSWLRG